MTPLRPSLIALSLAVAGCATTPSPQEQAMIDDTVAQKSIVAASASEREAVSKLSALERATFWNREYELNPADKQAAAEYATALRQIGNAERGAQIAEQALSMHPEDPGLLMAFGAARIDEGRAPAAIDPLTRAANARAGEWKPWSLLGVAHDMLEEYDLARARYERALSLSPNQPSVLSNLAMNRLQVGEVEEAERLLRQALAAGNPPPQARQNLAMVLALQGRFDEAERYALIDVPALAAEANLDYVKSLLTRPNRWDDLREGG